MRISFLIPSYNHSQFISYALDSIVADAKALDFEIILIDDGSVDNSKEVIENWREKNHAINFKAFYRENRGVSATLNELVRYASGEVIRLCASDDGIYPGSSSLIISIFESNNALVLVGDAYVIDEFGCVTSESAININGGNKNRMLTSDGLRREIVANWSIPGPCFAIRRQAYEVVGYYAEDLVVEDWDFFLRVAALCPVLFVEKYFSFYRVHSGNASRTVNVERRIKNLVAQLTAGERRLELFDGFLRRELRSECALINLKIKFLKKDYIGLIVSSLIFIFSKFRLLCFV